MSAPASFAVIPSAALTLLGMTGEWSVSSNDPALH
jgi:hypothetical protein